MIGPGSFRGKSLITGEWQYGYYVKINNHSYIIEDCEWNEGSNLDRIVELGDYSEVDPKTVELVLRRKA